MATVPRIPAGALWGDEEGLVLANDRNRRTEAARYWVARLKSIQTDTRDLGVAHVFGLSAAVPDTKILDHLKQNGLDRTRLTSTNDGGLRETGCLLSLVEIARATLGRGARPRRPSATLQQANAESRLQNRLAVVHKAAEGGTAKAEELRDGFRVARELFDLGRRLLIIERIARERDLHRSEALALFRQEAGFAIAPPQPSWPHGPLIATADTGCRLTAVTLDERSTERPGFNLVHRFKADGVQGDTDESGRLAMLWRNLAVTGGLDAIVLPISTRPAMQVAPRAGSEIPFVDELAWCVAHDFLDAQGSGIGGVVNRWVLRDGTKLMSEGDVATLVRLLVGLTTAETDQSTGPPDASTLFAAVRQRLDALMLAHSFTREGRNAGANDCFLADDDAGAATSLCLGTQCLWYATRSRLHTLLAVADRASAPDLPNLSPFMTYLRFQAGEVFFMRLLLRTLARLGLLKKELRSQRSAALLQALDGAGWTPAADKRFRALSERFFKAAPVRGRVDDPEPVWHGIGFHAAVLPQTPYRPSNAASDLVKRLGTLREVVRDTLNELKDRRLLVAASVALEFIPLDTLVRLKCVQPALRSRVAKTHGFERLRLSYEIALRAAGQQATEAWFARWPWRPGYKKELLPDSETVGSIP
jgi:hypothetical protein